MTTRPAIDADHAPDLRERTIDGERVLEALTEEGFAAGLDASLRSGVAVIASPDVAARFGLADHGEDSAELLDFLPPGAQLASATGPDTGPTGDSRPGRAGSAAKGPKVPAGPSARVLARQMPGKQEGIDQ